MRIKRQFHKQYQQRHKGRCLCYLRLSIAFPLELMVISVNLGLIWILLWIYDSFVNGLDFDRLPELHKRDQSDFSGNSTVRIKGISIGGWLTTEPYITPSLYDTAFNIVSETTGGNATNIVDEYTLSQALGYDRARDLLAEHFNTWITEDDFRQISEDGFNLVRIPIGYWAWKTDSASNTYLGSITFEDPYVSDGLQLRYLDNALGWAPKYGLDVWIDLHGAPDTQNGFDNSGQRDLFNELNWLKSETSRDLTMAIWESIFETYLSRNVTNSVVGIEIMNEPLSPRLDEYSMKEYYYKAFELYKQGNINSDNTTFVIHDAFKEIGHWNLYLNPDYNNVTAQYANFSNITFQASSILVDHHHYEVFTEFQLHNNQSSRITDIMNYAESVSSELSFHPALIGEFSAALTDCALWINGVGIGARYDGSYYRTTNFTTDYDPVGQCQSQLPVSNWTDEFKDHVRQFVEVQLATYTEKSNGWIFWNWKTENATEWDYLRLKENGLFPTPLDNYTYFQSDGQMQNFFSSSLFPRPSTSSSATSTTSSTQKSNGASSLHQIFNLSTNPEKMSFAWKFSTLVTVICVFTFINIM